MAKSPSFLVPFPMHIVEDQPWPPLECNLGARTVSIQKPIYLPQGYAPAGRTGNEISDAFCSIIQVHCLPDAIQAGYPKQGELWPLIERLLSWIRVKARHYWVLHGDTGFDTLYRGSLMTQESSRISQRNFAAYGNTLVVRPLEQDLWLTFANEINNGSDPPVSESIFCDALLSTVAGDEVKAVLELGVAIEIEITQLLADVCRLPPKTIQKRKFAAKGEWDKFYEKLASWPQKLGLQEAKTFDPTGNFKDWFDVVGDLYRLRGGVAHSGKLSPKMGHSIMKYLMATNLTSCSTIVESKENVLEHQPTRSRQLVDLSNRYSCLERARCVPNQT